VITHCVFLRVRPEVSASDRAAALAAIAAVLPLVEGALDIAMGAEQGIEPLAQGFTDGFVIRFRDRAALAAYAAHPAHRAAGARLVSLCQGGTEGLMVFDIES
jgi:hypothetical protein